jgi:hypothetical protein
MKDLTDTLRVVKDESSFLDFLRALKEDRETNAGRWAADKIEDYLGDLLAWAEDLKHIPGFGISDNPWRRMADLLYFGKTYFSRDF